MNSTVDKEAKYRKLIVGLSIFIPVAVAALFGVKVDGVDLSFLPPIYASVNGLTGLVLIAAVMAIKNKKVAIHERLMKFAIFLSCCFLVMYIAYHMTSDATPFGGTGAIKYVYYTILVTHILLSIAIIPLVLFTFVKALSEKFDQHKKLAKITFPLWLYVAVSGVVVYVMISPYYA